MKKDLCNSLQVISVWVPGSKQNVAELIQFCFDSGVFSNLSVW